jgi:long-chain acyl-CoA synthetase
MARRTLIDFFSDVTSGSAAPREFLVYDDGYRTWTWTYADLAAAAHGFAARLQETRIAAGQAIALWSENRPEWIAALWGALLEGVVVVPIDYRASAEFLSKVTAIVDAKVVCVGDAVDVDAVSGAGPIWRLHDLFRATDHAPRTTDHASRITDPATTAEIIFTSGATAEPKGVVLTHKNVLANIVPIEREMAKYRKYTIPFRPLRFLNLLPLSHMFGQAMATFVPPMLPGVVIFTRSYAPDDIVRQIHDRRVSVLVCVPKLLEVLKEYVLRVAPEAAEPPPAGMHWAKRWWRFRRIHRMFGFKFWAMVVGAAPLDPDLEAFWGRLGFLVVQGYGLTETAPIVTLNHPLHAKRGVVGKPIAGVEVRIASDGEILVRGENVTTGYYNAPAATREAFEDGWFHTGDIGELDAEGRLLIRGRKKEMIVTPEGLNVFPEDVERAVNEQPGVRDSAVVGAPVPGSTAERVQAVLLLDPGTDLDVVVRGANATLGDHQRIRTARVWPGDELPRTEGTRKLKRRELRQWLIGLQEGQAASSVSPGPTHARSVASILERFAPGRDMTPQTTIGELGLTSLERVELMMALEEAFQVTVDEGAFSAAGTVGQLEALIGPHAQLPTPDTRLLTPSSQSPTPDSQGSPPDAQRPGSPKELVFPSWNRTWPVRTIRRASLPTWILPLGRIFASVTVTGLEHLDRVEGPVIFAANHQSHFDTPVVLDSLPPRWRYRVATAMSREFFNAHFFPERFTARQWFTNSLNYYLASFFFNAFPLAQGGGGTRQTLRYMGELVTAGFSILIYPEGRRAAEGEIGRFLPGVGMIGSRLGVPVVPVRLGSLDKILGPHAYFPTRGPASCAFGSPISLTGNDYAALALRVEEAVRSL